MQVTTETPSFQHLLSALEISLKSERYNLEPGEIALVRNYFASLSNDSLAESVLRVLEKGFAAGTNHGSPIGLLRSFPQQQP